MEICKYDSVSYLLAENPAIILQAKKLHHDVYLDYGYIEEFCQGGIIFDEKNDCSDFVVAVDEDSELIGTMRLTSPSPTLHVFDKWEDALLPNGNHFIEMVHGSTAVELGALAVRRDMQKRKISWGLYKATLLYSLLKEINYWVIAMDNRALRSLEMLGWYVERIGESIHYMGSSTTLGIMPILLQKEHISRKNRKYYNFITM